MISICKEEKALWQYCFDQIPDCEVQLDNLIHIFLCNSYFSDIASIDPNDCTTDSLLVAVAENNKFYYFHAIEYISNNSYQPNRYDMEYSSFNTPKELSDFIHEDCIDLKKSILNYSLQESLEIKPSIQRNKI